MDEKPLECSMCKRKCSIIYKKVEKGEVHSTHMCSLCPVLQKKIGIPVDSKDVSKKSIDLTQSCPKCHTTLEELTIDGKVGCQSCYETFKHFLEGQLSENGQIPLKSTSSILRKKSIPIHLGQRPQLSNLEDQTKILESLNSALNDAVQSESFEQAANLRDQIKMILEKGHGKEHKAS